MKFNLIPIIFSIVFISPTYAFWSRDSNIKNNCAKYKSKQITFDKVVKKLKLKNADWRIVARYCSGYGVDINGDPFQPFGPRIKKIYK
tara:strand:- start:667 stop:930 length:264 start_codon:yes stop_codon:yes gene_type:complete